MMECNYCGKKEAMGFHCHRCGKWFCRDHKLPENHDCSCGCPTYKPSSPRQIKKKIPEERVRESIFYLDKESRMKKGG